MSSRRTARLPARCRRTTGRSCCWASLSSDSRAGRASSQKKRGSGRSLLLTSSEAVRLELVRSAQVEGAQQRVGEARVVADLEGRGLFAVRRLLVERVAHAQ